MTDTTIMYCGNCEKIIFEGEAGLQALDARDFHEFDHGHEVVEYAEVGESVVQIIETVKVGAQEPDWQ